MATTDDILRSTLVGVMLDSQTWMNVWHYRVVSGTELDYAVINDAIEAHMDTAYALIEASVASSVDTIDLLLSEWDFTDNEWDGKDQSSAGCLNGSGAGDSAPNGISAVVRFVTDEIRRQGRKFIPGVIETHLSGNTISVGFASDLVDFADIMAADVTAGGATLRPCVFNDKVGTPRFETSSDFTGDLFVNADVGYQRRRQVGAGI